jgi:MoxR-like ATPase
MNDAINIELRARVKSIETQLNGTFIEREQAVQCLLLALLTQSNFILVGDPGTAKTALVKAAYSHVENARVFNILCGSFATEDKVFGPVDINGFKAGKWGRVLDGRLAAVELGMLDEQMKSNEGTLNGMLTALNERVYEGQPIPLRTCGAASNWPEVKARGDNVAALWDRMLLRAEVREVKARSVKKADGTTYLDDANEIALLEAADKVRKYQPTTKVTIDELDAVAAFIRDNVTITPIARKVLVDVRHRLAKEKVNNSGRRMAALQGVLRASAWLDGRSTVTLEDFDVLRFGLWHDKEQIALVDSVLDTIDQETVKQCIKHIDEALAEHARIANLATQRRLEGAPVVIKKMTESAQAVQKLLAEPGATRKGRERVSKAMESLREKFKTLKTDVEKHLDPK